MPADERLARLAVLDLQRRILALEHVERVLQLLPFGARFRFDCHRDDRLGKLDRFQQDRRASVADRVAGDRLPHANDADDIARFDAFDLLFLLRCVDMPKLSDVFLEVLARIQHAAIGFQQARIDANPVNIACLRRQHFEHQATEGFADVWLANELLRLLSPTLSPSTGGTSSGLGR